MNVKLTKQEAEMVIQAISAYIREEERECIQAERKGYASGLYYHRKIDKLVELKRNIINQTN